MQQWSINDVTMTGYPSNICSTKINVLLPKIKNTFGRSI
jgi:hypothetical protein